MINSQEKTISAFKTKKRPRHERLTWLLVNPTSSADAVSVSKLDTWPVNFRSGAHCYDSLWIESSASLLEESRCLHEML
ncbi:hypothetical protein R1flu_022337 [Riccia fluitans]|uniref:Uncharacterized protein n=1 Tax=Riccia fluitans TaxID=41844 RepID=A0ABD1ZRZ4_9MARC